MQALRAILFHGGVRAALWWVGPLAGLLVVACVVARMSDVGIAALTHDPNSLRGVPFYAGLLSNVGVMLWAATAGVCFFAAGLARRRQRGQRWFFLLGGLLTTLLLLDDLFMLHQDVFAGMFGIPEPLTYFAYAAVAAGFLLAFRRRILAGEFVPLAAALALFGVSVALDVVLPAWELLEDGAKLLGIGCWSAYFVTTAARDLRTRLIETELTALAAGVQVELDSATTALDALRRARPRGGRLARSQRAGRACRISTPNPSTCRPPRPSPPRPRRYRTRRVSPRDKSVPVYLPTRPMNGLVSP